MLNVLKRNNVQISGNGNQNVIFAHGYGCDHNVWAEIIPHFTDNYKVINFDFVGCGASDLSAYEKERYSTLNGYAMDILEICEALEISDAIFVGHSVSAMVGALASIQKPQLFEKLIFIGPSPRYLNDTGYIGGFERDELEGLFQMMDSNYLGWSQALAPAIMANPERPQLAEGLTNSFCASDPEIARQFARVTFLSDNRADLPKITVPSLTLQCTEDIIAPTEVGHYMNQHVKNNTFVQLRATGHCPHLSAPEETVMAIKSYLN